MKKFPNRENIGEELATKADLLMQAGLELTVQRSTKNSETGEVKPGKLQHGWKLLNIKGKYATLYRENEVFGTNLEELKRLNPEQFDIDTESLQRIIDKKKQI